jgi:D-alanyl-D-alanine carboxypeptidase
MTDSSGLIDDNDVFRSPDAYLARVKDARLRAQLAEVAARLRANPAAGASPLWMIRLAAWQPLLFSPSSRYHHSNIGWNIVGLIAARVGGRPLPVLYREWIFHPLGLKQTSYDPQGPIAGSHAQGYGIAGDGTLTDTTTRAPFKGADGAIVSNAADTASFLTGLMSGKLVNRSRLQALWGGGAESGCGRGAYVGSGAGDGYKTNVLVNGDGSRVAVLLLNGRTARGSGDETAAAAALGLYCAA